MSSESSRNPGSRWESLPKPARVLLFVAAGIAVIDVALLIVMRLTGY